ncbi:MAG: transcriptional repressor [Deltaproteobacteria bacterium]|nr:transcriptional repressor [Deltaproteobacteria bacterium]
MRELIDKYKGQGFKMTPQRLAILKYLEGNTSHPTAEDIYKDIRKTYPTVSFATVYNTIETLCKRGDVMEVTIDPGRKHFDPNPAPHHHIICTSCNTIGDVFVDYSSALNLPESIRREYAVSGNHVDFYGICKACRGRKHDLKKT